MVSNRINLSKAEIKELINKICNSDRIIFIDRNEDSGKKPALFFAEVGIDYTDAIEIIKNLSYDNYQYTQLDQKNKFVCMHIFYKNISNKIAYIKIGFKSDKTVVISFHEKKYL